MAVGDVKDETACYPTEALICREPRRHYRARINPIHWQLRSLIGAVNDTVYFPAGIGNLHIQEFDTATRKSETIAELEFSPRCLVARQGWVCCGGEEGEFVAIRVNATRGASSSQSPSAIGPGRGRRESSDGAAAGSTAESRGGAVEGSSQDRLTQHPHRMDHDHNHDLENNENNDNDSDNDDNEPGMDDEEYDDFDMRMTDAALLVTVPSRLVAKSQKFGTDRVNCITIWTPSSFVPLWPGAYSCPIAALSNNDKQVTLVNLETAEELDVLEYPDCVNRAVISPDGRLLVAVSDDPYLYIHERVEKQIGGSNRLARGEAQTTPAKHYEWKLLAKHHLRGQSRVDTSVHRGSFAACFSNTGRYLAVATQYGVIHVYETSTLANPNTSLVACFNSSNPNVDSGAVREMSFCPGPYDLLAWSEDHGSVGVADVRNGFVSRQILQLCDDDAYEHVNINEVIRNDEFEEERQRRRTGQQGAGGSGNAGGGDSTMSNTLNESASPSANDYDMTSSEQAMRIRDALDWYHMPTSSGDAQNLRSMQSMLRRQRLLREQQALLGRDQRDRDRDRDTSDFGRRAAWLLRSRPSLGSRGMSSGADNSSAMASGSGSGSLASTRNTASGIINIRTGTSNSRARSAARTREQNENVTMAVNDILGSLRNLRNARDAADVERRWLAPAPTGLLQAAQRASAFAAGVENDDSGSDDNTFTTRDAATSTTRQRDPLWGSGDGSGGIGGQDDVSNSRTMDILHAYQLGDQPPAATTPATAATTTNRAFGGIPNSTRRANRNALPLPLPDTVLNSSSLLAWDSNIPTARRAREPGPTEQKDGHTAGLAWSEDGSILYVGTEGGIYEFRVNIKSRMFYPSVTMR
ncbi:hypothetical protein HMPREF1624_05964 [Sporothrix schenckii ATCC 58251]|uniref:DUF2415 domain-containing protein n=1 Tax=Sporothrix schenckii (strain ATCC 58251 / de Perez 2211183) TaxID=1391915 RepID=U7PQ78_SPOS1|nr:hypothetical protein HMPREF1624_05964 [Sporothrix schenckii ATCC 58251]